MDLLEYDKFWGIYHPTVLELTHNKLRNMNTLEKVVRQESAADTAESDPSGKGDNGSVRLTLVSILCRISLFDDRGRSLSVVYGEPKSPTIK